MINLIPLPNSLSYAKRRQAVSIIVVHHTCSPTYKRTVADLAAQGYSTHFIVERDGRVFQLADPLVKVAHHCVGRNAIAIGVDLVHRSKAPWPPEQIVAAFELLSLLCNTYHVDACITREHEHCESLKQPRGIFGHSSFRPTQCPQGGLKALCDYIESNRPHCTDELNRIWF